MVAWAQNWVFSGFLSEEKFCEVDVRVEVDVHGELEIVDWDVVKTLAETAGMVADKNVYGPMLSQDFFPDSICVCCACQIGFVEVDSFEGRYACCSFNILQ